MEAPRVDLSKLKVRTDGSLESHIEYSHAFFKKMLLFAVVSPFCMVDGYVIGFVGHYSHVFALQH